MGKTTTFRVVGVSFVEGYPTNLHTLREVDNERIQRGESLPAILIRDPDNAYDANAIEVHSPAVGRIGSVPRHHAEWLAPLLDGEERWAAEIDFVAVDPDHPDRPGIDITIHPIKEQP